MMGNTVFLVEESNKESLTRPFFDEKTQSFAYSAGETLPYEQLGGEGFERLCYLILLNENKGCIPHYFGRKGQADHGVDLTLQDKKGDYTLYQCKNWKYKDNLSVKEFRGFFDDFNNRWVREQDLPKPGRFILCTSMRIDKHKPNNEAFLFAKEEFEKKFLGEWGQSILVEYWDRTALDNKLKNLPDITADMFNSDIAMRHCVSLEDWKDDIFIPVNHRQKSVDGYLKDYFNKREKFYIPDQWKIEFFEKIKETNIILIKGYPGTGKTCISLELASRFFFDNTKIGKHPYVYYLNFKDYFTPEELIRGIKRRRSLPTVFIFDDCQAELKRINDRDYDRVNTLNQRIRQIIKDRDIYCIYLYRTTLTEEDKTDEDPDFIDFFGKENIVKFKTGNQLFERILEKVKPWLIKEIDIDKLYRLAGGDLYILDFILSSVNNGADFDKFNTNRNELYEKVIDKYFKTRVGRGKFDGVLKISSLAQFDIGIHPGYNHNICREITGEKIKKALGELVVEAGPPGQSKCYFLHSSLAELICRSAFYINGSRTPFIEDISANVVEYFKFLSAIGVPREEFNKDLGNFLSNVLKLSQDQEETGNIKKNFLNSKEILQMVKKIFELIYPDSIMKMLLISEGHGSFNNYYNILKEKIKNGTYIDILISYGNIATGLFIKWMDTSYSGLFKQLKSQIDGDKLNQLIKVGNFQSFISLLRSFFKKEDKEHWNKLIEPLDIGNIYKVIERTIRESSSIGTIHLGFRDLRDKGLLSKLEKKIGAANYLYLIEKNGTFIELINILRYSTDEMANALIDIITEEWAANIIWKVIHGNRSIGTIGLVLRELGEKGLLEKLEKKIGVPNYLKLIENNGTFIELIGFIQYSTDEMGNALIDTVTEEWAANIIRKTIREERSIGTIGLGLRELGEKGLLEKLEKKIGVANYFNLIGKNGTFIELIRFIEYSNTEMAYALIDTVTEEWATNIIWKTIHEGRSIGTINLGLRELKEKGLLEKLEKKIGAANYLNLIENNGTFIELNRFMQYSTNDMMNMLIERLSAVRMSKLIDKTIEQKSPMSSIHWDIKRLKNMCGILSLDFEEKIGTNNIIRLIIANGNPGLFPNVLESLSEMQKMKLIENFNCLPANEKDDIILRGHFYNLCFALENCPQLHIFPSYTRVRLVKKAPVIEKLIEKSDFKSINMGIKCLDNLPNQELKTFLREYVSKYIDNLNSTHIIFKSNGEKINFLLILNRLEKLDIQTIEKIASTIDDKKFGKEKGFVISLRLLQFLLSVYEVDTRWREKIMDLSNSKKTVKTLEKENLLNTFLYLWNTYALFRTENPGHFHQWVDPEAVNAVLKIIEKNNRAKWGTKEYRQLLSLIGLLNYLQIEAGRIRQIFPTWYRVNLYETFLGQELENETFIPGFFYLKGIEFFIKRPVFPQIWKKLIPKIDDYSEKRPTALQEVINVLQENIRGNR